MEDKARAHLIVSGRVQGVWFRAETQQAARRIGVHGWVRNNRDGTVEAVVEGARTAVLAMIDWCRTGPSRSRVEKVEVAWQPCQGDSADFEIHY
ncbi:acylphosphatase [Desulfosarcina sp.]|jgi:acylphosphatase|uniref:acylphosphatase n=1 Tax=Desulfosarcina sp. TaxID=2027861 RepID=UPI003970D051